MTRTQEFALFDNLDGTQGHAFVGLDSPEEFIKKLHNKGKKNIVILRADILDWRHD